MCKSLQSLLRFLCCCAEAEHMQNVSAWTYFLRNDRCVAQSKVVHRESTHTHTPYLESTHTHTRTIYFTESAQRMYISTHAPYSERAHAHTHTPHILQKARARHIFYRRGDTAQNILQQRRQCQGMDSLHAQRPMIRAK